MRIYQNPVEMVKEVERDLFEMGVRYHTETVQDKFVGDDPGYRAIELTGYAYSLTASFDNVRLEQMMKYLNGNVEWAKREEVERLLGTRENAGPRGPLNPGESWKLDSGKWGKFIRDGKFSYSYGERWQAQLPYVIDELKRRPTTRQAIMTMYDVHQDMMNWGGRDRVPCSISYQFVLRNGNLTLIYNQRSCDFMKFFASDVYLTTRLLQHVASEINATPSRFVHFIGSLHAFAKDLEGRNIF